MIVSASLRPLCRSRCRVVFSGEQQRFFKHHCSLRFLGKEKGARDMAPEASADRSDFPSPETSPERKGGFG